MLDPRRPKPDREINNFLLKTMLVDLIKCLNVKLAEIKTSIRQNVCTAIKESLKIQSLVTCLTVALFYFPKY